MKGLSGASCDVSMEPTDLPDFGSAWVQENLEILRPAVTCVHMVLSEWCRQSDPLNQDPYYSYASY